MTRHGPAAAAAAMLASTAMVLTGCGSEQSTTNPRSGDVTGDAAVDGRSFLSTAVTPRRLEPGTRIRLSFEGESVSAHAGCNSLFGDVRIDSGRLLSTGSIGMTDMGCQQPLMEQDAWLADLLGSSPELELVGDELTVRAADGTVIELVDRRVADPDRPLVGTEWVLDAIIDGAGPDGVVSSIPGGVTSKLRVTDGGRLSLQAGCNSGGAEIEVVDGSLRLGPVATTRARCSEERMRVEAAVLAVVQQGEVSYSIEADRLTLTNGDHRLDYQSR